MTFNQFVAATAHCINPDCPRPYPQTLGNFCSSCGSPLVLKNRYIPLQRLGIGGFAAIYTVWDQSTKIEKVLKVLLDASPKALALFEQEALVLANLRHPGVPRVEPDGYFQVILGNSPQRMLPCLVMEKITGQTLEDILVQYPQGCPEAWVLDWLKQAVDILRELHRRKIIHRDIKPSNLMLRNPFQSSSYQRGNQLVLIDFGGAKQMTFARSNSPGSSTRLFSPGYSPPEQMAGGGVGLSADFYALGMTCIHLLTGVYPPDLEDPNTGELRWRNSIFINPGLADLLDEMVQPDVRRRPPHASRIRWRILKIYRRKFTLRSILGYGLKWMTKIISNCLSFSWNIVGLFSKIIYSSIFLILRFLIRVIQGCFHTFWLMLVGGVSSAMSAAVGFWLAYHSPVSQQIDSILTQELLKQLPGFAINDQSAVILFALAGFGTAWSLKLAGWLGKRQGLALAGLLGMLGYVLGWLIWQGIAPDGVGLVGMSAIASYFLAIGLGLRSHQLMYALVCAAGTASVFAALMVSNILPFDSFNSISHAFSQVNESEFTIRIAFFSFLGIVVGFCLGISHYLFVPLMRLFGWR